MGHPHILARGAEHPPRRDGEPFGARGDAFISPPLTAIELGDESEHLVGCDVDPGGEFDDAFAELKEVVVHGSRAP